MPSPSQRPPRQLSFFDAETPREGTCAFGQRPWNGPDHCRRCHAEVNRAVREFAALVKQGAFDARGYTRNANDSDPHTLPDL